MFRATLALAAVFALSADLAVCVKDQTAEQVELGAGQSTSAPTNADGSTTYTGDSSSALVSSSGFPYGDYTNSCYSCQWVGAYSTLSCYCYDSTGNPQLSTYQNAWACTGCLTNINGQLTCQLPASSSVNGYLNSCSQCGVNYGSLYCASCSGASKLNVIANACTSCSSVAYTSGSGLVCIGGTSAPTSPTNAPSFPTKSPTPNSAPLDCESYWLNINGNGIEKAPYKSCTGGQFSNSNGCQYQNYCCWQATSATTGVCKVPNGVPVDCPNLTTANSCGQYSPYCWWDSSYGTSGLCRRNCPGNPQTMCVY